MVSVRTISDLHTEFCEDRGKSLINSINNKNVDILVIAGDLTTAFYRENLIQLCERFPQVIYVPGNHDFFNFSIKDFISYLKEIQQKKMLSLSNLHILYNEKKQICGKWFAGTTLWYPENEETRRYGNHWVDFSYVIGGGASIYKENKKAIRFLKKNVDKDTCVITHHLPTYGCINEKYKNEPTNCYFANNIDDIILKKEPHLFISGHSHDPCDMYIHKTRYVRCPIGYPRENVFYDQDFLIHI